MTDGTLKPRFGKLEIETLGAVEPRSVILVMWDFSSPSAVIAVTATGTSCKRSSRLRAVTTISVRLETSEASGLASTLDCACASVTAAMAAIELNATKIGRAHV